jgi:hypothetical protein
MSILNISAYPDEVSTALRTKLNLLRSVHRKKSVGGLNERFSGLKNLSPDPFLRASISPDMSGSVPCSNPVMYLAQMMSSSACSVALYPIATSVTFGGFTILI